MLKNTFLHVNGLGAGTEKKLWDAGVRSWDDFLDAEKKGSSGLSVVKNKAKIVKNQLEQSLVASEKGDSAFFAKKLPANEVWRLFREFRDTVAYIDIETTGLGWGKDSITTIALYDGHDVKTYVKGINLQDFCSDIENYGVLITYNGKTFDIPFIEREFNIRINQAQIDLRYVLASLGYKGGLKRCEKMLGVDRGVLSEVDGYAAVLLWRQYIRTGNPKVLDTLLAYNVEDVINLEHLMVVAYNLNLKKTPFENSNTLPEPEICVNPYSADLDVIRSLSRY